MTSKRPDASQQATRPEQDQDQDRGSTLASHLQVRRDNSTEPNRVPRSKRPQAMGRVNQPQAMAHAAHHLVRPSAAAARVQTYPGR